MALTQEPLSQPWQPAFLQANTYPPTNSGGKFVVDLKCGPAQSRLHREGWAVPFQLSPCEAVRFWGATSACQTVLAVPPTALQERRISSPIANEESEPQKDP